MKKFLLFTCALFSAVAGFAQEYVYTANAKYKLNGASIVSNVVNADFAGWNVITATEGTALSSIFAYADGAYVSQQTVATEGMSYNIAGISSGDSYVVAVKMTQTAETTPHNSTRMGLACTHLNHDFNVLSITGTNMEDAEDIVECATATEVMPGEAGTTYYYAIPATEVGRSYQIKLIGFSTNIAINSIEVIPATQVVDDRSYASLVDYANKIMNARDWAEADKDVSGIQETLGYVSALTPETDLEEAAGIVEGLQDAIKEFLGTLDDFLPNKESKIPAVAATNNIAKANVIGDVWTGFGGGASRIHTPKEGGAYDVGHYAGNTSWGFGNGCNGITYQVDLEPGTYIYSMKGRAVTREQGTSSCWCENQGLSAVYGVMYIRPVGDAEAEANIVQTDAEYEKSIALAYEQFNMSPVNHDLHSIVVTITEAGKYEFAYKTYAQEHYGKTTNGGTFYPLDAAIYAKTNAKYTKAQYAYEEDVRGQIQAGLDNIQTAKDNLANAEKYWGKADLQAALEAAETAIAAYAAMSQDEIIATYDGDIYDKGKGLEVISDVDGESYARLLASEVYRTVVKDIIAANTAFANKNAVLESLDKAIADAEAALEFRIYDKATGKSALEAAIAEAKAMLADMKTKEYSEDVVDDSDPENPVVTAKGNKTIVNEMVEKLKNAVDEFKATIPASAVTVLADIDFEAAPVAVDPTVDLTTANGEATIAGAVNSMLITSFTASDNSASVNNAYQLGWWSNGEDIRAGILHVGNGDGIVEMEVPADAYGTDVIRVSMDWWFGSLSGKNCGFYLKDAEDANVGGLFFSPYSNTSDYDPCSIRATGYVSKGRSGVENDQICMDDDKTHMEYVVDCGNKVMYAISNTPKGVYQTVPVALDSANPIAKFVLTSNYNNMNRRSWFDNLKIERIAADPNTVTAIQNVVNRKVISNAIYNLAGQRVDANYRGVVIKNGVKVMQ